MRDEDWSHVAEAIKKASVKRKPKVALYMAGGCGGCDLSLTTLGRQFLDLIENIDLVLWPLITDHRYSKIKRMYNGAIDLCLFTGAVLNDEQKTMARLLRKKSKIFVALGSCAYMGGIPGMVGPKEKKLESRRLKVPEGTLSLPRQDHVCPLSDIVEVDYVVPGCPPTPSLILRFLVEMLEAKLPARGSIFAGDGTICDECGRERKGTSIRTFRGMHESACTGDCLLDQGFLCMGPVTRAGCRGRCISVNMACRGCFGPAKGIIDVGGGYISVLASVMAGEEEDIKKTVDSIPSLSSVVYRFSLPSSILKKKAEVLDE